MERFISIPAEPLVCILMDWLSLEDLARLDSAACNRIFRDELHHSIAASPHAHSEKWADGGDPGVQWLIERGMKCSTVYLSVVNGPKIP